MEISIQTSMFELFPDLTIKGLVVIGVDQARVPCFSGSEQFVLNQEIDSKALIKQWQKVYKQFPTDKKSRCSIEYLVWAFNKERLRTIHPLVDLYNKASLMTLCPFGGEDMACFYSDQLILGQAKGEESFIPLGKNEIEHPEMGEVAWLDGEHHVVCRSLNWLESDHHKLTENSQNIVFVSEQISSEFPDAQKGIDLLNETLSPISKNTMPFVLNKENDRFVFEY